MLAKYDSSGLVDYGCLDLSRLGGEGVHLVYKAILICRKAHALT